MNFKNFHPSYLQHAGRLVLTIAMIPIAPMLSYADNSTSAFDDEDLPACIATPLPDDVVFATIDSDCGYAYGLAPVLKDNKYGYVNEAGEIVITPKYQEAYPFSDGLALYRQNNKYGYLNSSGKVAIAPKYQDAWGFWEGRAKIQQNGKYGFIDTTGKVIIKPQYDVVGDWFEEGLVLFKQGDQYGYLDKSGNIAISPRFDSAKDFSEGLAAVTQKTGETDAQGVALHKYGFIDKTGQVVIDIKYDLVYDFLAGAAYVVDGDQAYYIDKQGNQTAMPDYSEH